MVTDRILSIPFELVHRILRGCDKFSDLVALASCCKSFHAAWLSQAPSLIWELASTRVVAFDSALIAVRATKIVADAQNHGIEPPHPFPVRELSGKVQKPLPEEMKTVFDFEHLVKCAERMMFDWNVKEQPGVDSQWGLIQLRKPLSDERGNFGERLYRGIYNILLAGAICSRPYNAPFFLAEKEGRTDFLERCARRAPLIGEDFEYLRHFPVYNFQFSDDSDTGRWRDTEYESLFGPLAEWLIEDGARRGLEEKLLSFTIPIETFEDGPEKDWENGGLFDGSQIGSIREIKILQGAYEHFHRKVSRENHARPEAPNWGKPTEDFRGQREVNAVVFGFFQLDEISMPWKIEDSEKGVLYARPLSGFPLPRVIDVHHVLDQVRRQAWFEQDNHSPPPPQLQLFSFILRRFLGLKWQASAYDTDWHYRHIYLQSIEGGDIFEVPYPDPWHNDNLVMYRLPILSRVADF